MRALVLENKTVRLERERPDPEPGDGFVTVQTLVAGVCNTDLELARGYMGFSGVLGHEFVGEALDGAFAGRRVVGGINFGCGSCPTCDAGMARHCPTRTVLGILGADGVFADRFVIPERNLLVVPDGVADRDAVFAEPLAAACEILEQLADLEPQPALVLGDGKLGTLVAQVLAAHDFDVTLVGRHTDTLGWIAERGVTLAAEVADGRHWGLVVDATGSAEGLQTAIAATRPRGHLVLKTTVADGHSIDLAPVVINEITVVGSRCGQFGPALELLAAGRVSVAPLVEQAYGLDAADDALTHAGRRGSRKILIGGR